MTKGKFQDPRFLHAHYNTSIYRGYLSCLVKTVGEEKAREIVEKMPLGWDYLNKDDHWVSEEFSEIFFDVLAAEPSLSENFSYEAGLVTMSKESLGTFPHLVSKLISTHMLFGEAVKHARKLNKIDHLDIIQYQPGLLHVRVRSNRETKHARWIAENWHGCMDGVLNLHRVRNRSFKLREQSSQCIEFEVRWSQKNRDWHPVVLWTALVLLVASFIGDTHSISTLNLIRIGLTSIIALALHMFLRHVKLDNEKETSILERIISEQEERHITLTQSQTKLDRRFKEANLLRGVIARIMQNQTVEGLISQTIDEIKRSLAYDRVLYLNFNPGDNSLSILSQSGFSPQDWTILSKYRLDLTQITDHTTHLGRLFRDRQKILIPVTDAYLASLSPEGRQLIDVAQSTSFIACTVATEKTKFGVLLVDYKSPEKSLTHDDLHIIENLSNQLAILLENVSMLEKETSLRKAFQRYVPSQVITQLMASGPEQSVARDGNVTILFSDIRDFTTLSENLDPEKLVLALNHYFSRMTDIVYKHGGIVDKFLGDGLMAIFNAFDDGSSHAEQAVAAAFEMQSALPVVNHEIEMILGPSTKFKPFSIGIGIHSGGAVVGNIGSHQKTEFTALGRTVNTAARLQELTKILSPIVVSAQTLKGLKSQGAFVDHGPTSIRGMKEPLQIYGFSHQQWTSGPHKDHAKSA